MTWHASRVIVWYDVLYYDGGMLSNMINALICDLFVFVLFCFFFLHHLLFLVDNES